MEEKVLWVKLPENSKYQRVKVAEDGMIGLVYEKETNRYAISGESYVIPKPQKLIGGTEVYLKKGLPYWFCKIKNGRDEFMHIYMQDLTEQDLMYDSKTGKLRKFKTQEEMKFKANVLEALKNKCEEGYRWVPVCEPSLKGRNELQFIKNRKPLVESSCYEWEKMMSLYSPENESGKGTETTYFLLQLRWLKDGIATLEQLVKDSTEIGHYRNSKNAKHVFEKTGRREFGGLCGFVGNTYKIIWGSKTESFLLAGGSYILNGNIYPVASTDCISDPSYLQKDSVALLELKK